MSISAKSSNVNKDGGMKRKAESPKLVLESQKAKKAKIIPSKTLQSFLSKKDNIADHIQIQYSHKVCTDFLTHAKGKEEIPFKPHNRKEEHPCKHGDIKKEETSNKPKNWLQCSMLLKDQLAKTHYNGTEIMEMLKSLCPGFPSLNFKTITAKELELKYSLIFPAQIQRHIIQRLEKEIEYISDAKIKIFGKVFSIPRKQVAFGDSGLTYTFSGTTVKALEWTPLTRDLLNIVNTITNETFNFVLINRYKDGRDHIGEHRDDEKDLDLSAPIASLSFGAARDFVLRHKDLRNKKAKVDPVKINLESGSLLLMNPPTNLNWYHSLPVRKNCSNPRINLTFRKIIRKK